MARTRQTVEARLAMLHALKGAGDSPEARAALRSALADEVSLVVAKAAAVVASNALPDFADALEAAYRRFDKTADKGCAARSAIARALYELAAPAGEVFLHGIGHVQMEPSWGGPIDTAAELRGYCALGLVRMGHRQALARSADLLADKDRQARIFGARALAYSGAEQAALPLRVKVLIGDDDPEILGECFTALLKLAPEQSMPLVARFLESDDPAAAEIAALALGEMRSAAALELLLARWERNITTASRRVLATAIAAARLPRAIEFLIHVARTAPSTQAIDAIEALAIYRHDERVAAEIASAVAERDDDDLTRAFQAHFPRR